MKWLLLKSWDKLFPSLHACPVTPLMNWQSFCGQAKLMSAGRNGHNLIRWDADTTQDIIHPPWIRWSLDSLAVQGPPLFLLWSFHYCKVCVKALFLYSSEDLHFIITYFPFILKNLMYLSCSWFWCILIFQRGVLCIPDKAAYWFDSKHLTDSAKMALSTHIREIWSRGHFNSLKDKRQLWWQSLIN